MFVHFFHHRDQVTTFARDPQRYKCYDLITCTILSGYLLCPVVFALELPYQFAYNVFYCIIIIIIISLSLSLFLSLAPSLSRFPLPIFSLSCLVLFPIFPSLAPSLPISLLLPNLLSYLSLLSISSSSFSPLLSLSLPIFSIHSLLSLSLSLSLSLHSLYLLLSCFLSILYICI